MTNTTYKWPLILGVIIIASIGTYAFLTMQDHRSATEKIGDAIHELPQGLDKAGRQLEERTPAQKLGDAVKDTGDEIKENTNP
ncbi:MAG: hypothetical protein SFW62_04840 [Alphaproteobacteria bacterium]|nr:hypothetical protein [Alphaproteobacteria bacterium]